MKLITKQFEIDIVGIRHNGRVCTMDDMVSRLISIRNRWDILRKIFQGEKVILRKFFHGDDVIESIIKEIKNW
jgi:hypothetical protein